jgi:predicted tellurium resistance membrane protein TerC
LLAISLLELRGSKPAQPTRVAVVGNRGAIAMIFLVELSVSLDNVLGAAAAAAGNLVALGIGLTAGMAIALAGGVLWDGKRSSG